MIYKLLVNAVEIYINKNDPSPKFYSKNDLTNFKVENKTRVILSFESLNRVFSYTFDDLEDSKITELRDFFGI